MATEQTEAMALAEARTAYIECEEVPQEAQADAMAAVSWGWSRALAWMRAQDRAVVKRGQQLREVA